MEIIVGRIYIENSGKAWARTVEVTNYNEKTRRVSFRTLNTDRVYTWGVDKFVRQHEPFFIPEK